MPSSPMTGAVSTGPRRTRPERETSEDQRGDGETEVTQRDVPVLTGHDEVDDDEPQPRHDDVGRVARDDRDEKTGHDLDDADAAHEELGAHADRLGDRGSEVLLPVDHGVEELIGAHEDREHGEARPQQ